jgi:uncharacterized protein involved in exopolysaccharide biosynthesis
MTAQQFHNDQTSDPRSVSIRFEDILLFLKRQFVSLIIIGFICGILGFSISYLFTITYEAHMTLLPEYTGSRRGSSSLALLTGGINSDGAEKLVPDLYPTILQSSLFGIYLLKQPVTDQTNKQYKSLKEFLEASSKPGLLSGLLGSSKTSVIKPPIKLSDPDIYSLTATEYQNVKSAMGLVAASIDQKIGIITISSNTQDPVVSSMLVEAAKNYLITYVEEYRTAKAQQQADLLKDQSAVSKTRLRKAEFSLQGYRDRNRNPYTNVARIEEQTLQSEYLLAESLNSDLTRRYEQALLKVKEEKPVFKVLEPVNIPLTKSGPKRIRFFLISSVLGVIASLGYILFLKKNIMKPLFFSSSEHQFNDKSKELQSHI